ncbi:prolipoprotein diacylglyceryl transferase [Fulvimonas soli]|jgi:phosphatidylglycerol:prolipoprotein diacylglycerol transferase|uniref:Phosphatidylglycerol--prolipoprotein diacylglyceryl transferase n=1 Tax=Fulvimonas soli TaxID=155197 RepID=A0A316HU96_9GAMM|nr:prolipoprotein diacylglyceryl transferase [Fulvimonas soli]PWK84773.1 phosphatidylglycerol:prolipoprotein diacylglycerol transferase [Fulvimonas soli]TNY26894.1 prolipoprotein diacylglyceryl transferase [Fulvimonas soli]
MVYPVVAIKSVAFQLGPVQVHWYGLMYLLGFLGGWMLAEYRRRRGRLPVSRDALGDLAFYVMMGVIVGGRLGYMLFYTDLHWVVREPLALFKVWDGGMSFHGGLLGVLAAGWWWSRRHRVHFFDTVDFVAPLVPIGLGLGRLGNFINGELWGKPSTLPWAMIFPNAKTDDVAWAQAHPEWLAALQQYGGVPRQPSQLYEMLLEGVAMFTVLWLVSLKPRPRYLVSGLFGLLYGCFRFAVEFVRLPDPQLGYLAFGWLTMGQILSLPLIVVGLVLIVMSRRAPVLEAGTGNGERGTG